MIKQPIFLINQLNLHNMKSTATKQASAKRSLKTKSDAAQGLRELFEDELKDIYWAEKALTKALPKMAKNATSEELINAIEEHLEVTKGHVERCEQAFEMMDKPARAKKCEAMDGLIREAQDIMESTEEGVVRDAGIISGAQKIEHYEIASYGTLCAFAKTLGEGEIADLLEQTLNEEKEADQTLTGIAESSINMSAAGEDEEG
jgi:ferritin-like metal-binding protein YciE